MIAAASYWENDDDDAGDDDIICFQPITYSASGRSARLLGDKSIFMAETGRVLPQAYH